MEYSGMFAEIAQSLARDYEDIFYIDIETGKYSEFSPSKMYESMHVPTKGEDFYSETRENARRYAHPDDREFAEGLYYKEVMLEKLKDRKSFSYKYRIMVSGEPRYFRFTIIPANDGEHFVLCVKDINDEITAEDLHKKHVTFSQIAESLASNYDVIYYVDLSDNSYVSYTTNNIFGKLEVQNEAPDFFEEARRIAPFIVHPHDIERVLERTRKDFLLSELESKKAFGIEYRHIIEKEPQYIRLRARKSSDKKHLIIGIENINDEKKKEQDHLKALNTERELARRDELTGTKNKTAYAELEKSVQTNIDNGVDYLPFAIAVCDINLLKQINDTEGHSAGDEYIKASAKLLCNTFVHSPVFRIGGDEFAVFLRGDDYTAREKLIKNLKDKVQKNLKGQNGPVIAVGYSDFNPETDGKVTGVFERADKMMYENKRQLKE